MSLLTKIKFPIDSNKSQNVFLYWLNEMQCKNIDQKNIIHFGCFPDQPLTHDPSSLPFHEPEKEAPNLPPTHVWCFASLIPSPAISARQLPDVRSPTANTGGGPLMRHDPSEGQRGLSVGKPQLQLSLSSHTRLRHGRRRDTSSKEKSNGETTGNTRRRFQSTTRCHK